MADIKELLIIGAGPAGITASIYAARKKMNVAVLTRDIGGQTAWSGEIGNYTGFQLISGPELARKFDEHVRQFDLPIQVGVEVTALREEAGRFVALAAGQRYESQTAIIATGRTPRKLNVPGEDEFKNRGVTYCATCDGPLFAGTDVAVIGGGNSALDAALQLIKIARKVYLLQKSSQFTGDPVMLSKVMDNPLTEAYTDAEVIAIRGKEMVSALVFRRQGEERIIEVEGVFIEIGSEPASGIISGVRKNGYGEIIVDCRCRTGRPGLFAAGDVTDVPAKQIIVAAGEGAKAAISAFDYLSALPD